MKEYSGVTVRFLHQDERLISSEENEMPLVIEAKDFTEIELLKKFLIQHNDKILEDISNYGAILLRGFSIESDKDFESVILSLPQIKPINQAFMSEQGRVTVNQSQFVLHTNSVYKTGGTLYLGGFHSENYYIPDVPAYIFFCCLKPSTLGGETGLVNMQRVYQDLSISLKKKLCTNKFLAGRWLVSEVAERYQITTDTIEMICRHFDLPIIGRGKEKLILMYKPSIFINSISKKSALQINFFELPKLNQALRKLFIKDYQGSSWFWHRCIWRMPSFLFNIFESFAFIFLSFLHSPKDAFRIIRSKLYTELLMKKNSRFLPHLKKIKAYFTDEDIKRLAESMRKYYSSSLWKQGDILLIDNTQVVHAGMPGSGKRLIRAMISNPLKMSYSFSIQGTMQCKLSKQETIGFYMSHDILNPVLSEPIIYNQTSYETHN